MLSMLTDKDAWPWFALVGAMALVLVPFAVMLVSSYLDDRARRRHFDRLCDLIQCSDECTTIRDARPRPLPTARTVRA